MVRRLATGGCRTLVLFKGAGFDYLFRQAGHPIRSLSCPQKQKGPESWVPAQIFVPTILIRRSETSTTATFTEMVLDKALTAE